MEAQRSLPLNTLSTGLLVVPVVLAMVLAVATAFGIGYAASLQRAVLVPEARPSLALSDLRRAQDHLGYSGILGQVARVAAGGEDELAGALSRIDARMSEARRLVAEFRLSPAGERELPASQALAAAIADMAETLSVVRGLRGSSGEAAALFTGILPRLALAHRAFSDQVDAVARRELVARSGLIGSIVNIGKGLVVAALAAMLLTACGAAWILRRAVREPLQRLNISLGDVTIDPRGKLLWGTDREDEFGALARGIERLKIKLLERPELVREAAARPTLDQITRRLDAAVGRLEGSPLPATQRATPAEALPEPVETQGLAGSLDRIEQLHDEAVRLEKEMTKLAAEAVRPESNGGEAIGGRAEESIVVLLETIETINAIAATLSLVGEGEAKAADPAPADVDAAPSTQSPASA